MKLPLVGALVLCLVLVPACGGGSGVDGSAQGFLPPTPLVIETTSVPSGSTLAPYPATQIAVSGEDGPVSFGLRSGALPTGVTLSTEGILSGQPTVVDSFTFEVEASDGADVTARSYSVAVSDSFAFTVTAGLVGPDAWSEAPVSVSTVGATGTVSFSVVSGASGGTYTTTDGVAGTATWLPGTLVDLDDVLQATDNGTGQVQVLTIPVVQNPAPNQVAEFGSTDVWHVSTDIKRGSHGHRSDFLQALSSIGLLPAGTGSTTPTQLETTLDAAARLALLRELNLIFLRDVDGQTGTGLDISFPFFAPNPSLYTAPAETGQLSGGIARYSIMEIADQVSGPGGVLGRANFDVGNPRHDHDGGTDPFDGVRLGTFTDSIRSSFASWQNSRLLTSDPVTAADQSVVEDILYGRASTGSRHDEIEELLVFFSRALALVAAHEIAHSLGLDHNNGGVDVLMASSIGFSTSNLSTSNAVPLLSSEVSTLRNTNLPGAGRTSSLFAQPDSSKLAPARKVAVQAAQAP